MAVNHHNDNAHVHDHHCRGGGDRTSGTRSRASTWNASSPHSRNFEPVALAQYDPQLGMGHRRRSSFELTVASEIGGELLTEADIFTSAKLSTLHGTPGGHIRNCRQSSEASTSTGSRWASSHGSDAMFDSHQLTVLAAAGGPVSPTAAVNSGAAGLEQWHSVYFMEDDEEEEGWHEHQDVAAQAKEQRQLVLQQQQQHHHHHRHHIHHERQQQQSVILQQQDRQHAPASQRQPQAMKETSGADRLRPGLGMDFAPPLPPSNESSLSSEGGVSVLSPLMLSSSSSSRDISIPPAPTALSQQVGIQQLLKTVQRLPFESTARNGGGFQGALSPPLGRGLNVSSGSMSRGGGGGAGGGARGRRAAVGDTAGAGGGSAVGGALSESSATPARCGNNIATPPPLVSPFSVSPPPSPSSSSCSSCSSSSSPSSSSFFSSSTSTSVSSSASLVQMTMTAHISSRAPCNGGIVAGGEGRAKRIASEGEDSIVTAMAPSSAVAAAAAAAAAAVGSTVAREVTKAEDRSDTT